MHASAPVVVTDSVEDDIDGLYAGFCSALEFDLIALDDWRRLLERRAARAEGLCLTAVVDGRRAGMAAGHLEPGLGIGVVDCLFVHADARRRGAGHALLDELEQRFAARGTTAAQTSGVGPWYLWPGVDARATAALALFSARGYEPVREASNLSVDLATTDWRGADAGTDGGSSIRIARLTADERPAFVGWMARWGPGWAEEVLGAYARHPISAFVARDGQRYAGFAAYDANRRGWFGPMGTDEAYRGHGIGSRLLRRCLQDLHDQGEREAQISWVGPAEFYTRSVGARPDRRFKILRRPLGAAA